MKRLIRSLRQTLRCFLHGWLAVFIKPEDV